MCTHFNRLLLNIRYMKNGKINIIHIILQSLNKILFCTKNKQNRYIINNIQIKGHSWYILLNHQYYPKRIHQYTVYRLSLNIINSLSMSVSMSNILLNHQNYSKSIQYHMFHRHRLLYYMLHNCLS